MVCDAYMDGYHDAHAAIGPDSPGEPVAIACESGQRATGHLRINQIGSVTVTACGLEAYSSAVTYTVPDVVCEGCFPW
jgi:hypothetical protein